MPQVDFMVLCDYVRADGGLFHIVAGGIDRIRHQRLPAVHSIGIAARIWLTRAECEHQHDLQLIFQDTDGFRITEIRGKFGATYPDNVPAGWPAYAALAFNIALPLQKFGVYSFELLIDGDTKKSISVIVELPPEGA